MRTIKAYVRRFVQICGYDLVPYVKQPAFPSDFDDAVIDMIHKVRSYTKTSPERLFTLREAVKYVVNANIPGDIVECGVWRGGSMMAVATTLIEMQNTNRDLYLYDTFEGMTEPSGVDVDFSGRPAALIMEESKQNKEDSIWCYASLTDVQESLFSTGYPRNKLKFVKGKIEETIPSTAPDQISLLRLDTDWYESTRHELVHLYPRLSSGGVLVIDDYGHWQGSRKATDEYFDQRNESILFNRVDYTARIAIKLGK